MESVTIPVTKYSVVGTESGGVGVVVVAAVVEVGISEKEHVTCNNVFLHAWAQKSGKSDILERQVICCEKSSVTFITG